MRVRKKGVVIMSMLDDGAGCPVKLAAGSCSQDLLFF
jgi:hypothetical protein